MEEDLACINVNVPNDDLVSVTLNGLGPDYISLDTSIFVQGHMPDLKELMSLCLQEEFKLGKTRGASTSRSTKDQVFCSQGRGFNRGAQTFCGGQSNQNAQQTNQCESKNQRGRREIYPL